MQEHQDQFTVESTEERDSRINRVTGYILLGLGIAMAVWVFSNLLTVLNSPGKIALVEYIEREVKEGLISDPETREFTKKIPTGLFKTVSFVLFIFILSVATGLVKAFIYGGSKLLSRSDPGALKRLEEKLDRIEKR